MVLLVRTTNRIRDDMQSCTSEMMITDALAGCFDDRCAEGMTRSAASLAGHDE